MRYGKGHNDAAAGLHADTVAGRRRKAVAIYGLVIRTLQLARAFNDSKLFDEVLQSSACEAVALAGETGV
jgi:TetR/AcrR family transcriptional regulator, transcriptional repressor for nem operon